jgi:hypothetical protein
MLHRAPTAIRAAVALALALAALPALAQDSGKRKFSSLLNVDSLIDNYGRFLARKYNLNEQQDAFTQQLLRQKARQFLDRHEDNLRDLVDRMFEVRTGGEMSPEELVSWGQQVLPLFEEAKGVIIDGNAEWRNILTDEQKRIHDEDLKLMHQSLETTQEQLGRIVTGEMTVEEFRRPQSSRTRRASPPPPNATPIPSDTDPPQPDGRVSDAPPTGAQAPPMSKEEILKRAAEAEARKAEEHGGHVQPEVTAPQPPPPPPVHTGVAEPGRQPASPSRSVNLPAPKSDANFESEWEQYTRQFIEKYQLNDEQTQKALDILKNCQSQGERYLRSKESQLSALEARSQAAAQNPGKDGKSPGRGDEQNKIQQERQKLFEPLTSIFEKQLKPRLDRLPTRAQRKAAESNPNPIKVGAGGKPAAPPAARPRVVPPAIKPAAPESPGDGPVEDQPGKPGSPQKPNDE